MNLGGLLLQALLEYWPRTHINPMDEEENEMNHGEHLLVLCRSVGSVGCLGQYSNAVKVFHNQPGLIPDASRL